MYCKSQNYGNLKFFILSTSSTKVRNLSDSILFKVQSIYLTKLLDGDDERGKLEAGRAGGELEGLLTRVACIPKK